MRERAMTPPDRQPPAPRRVRVTSPRMRAAASRPRRATDDIDEQTGIGEVYMRSLVGSQLRLALGVLGGFVVSLCGLPMLFALAPALRQVDVVGIPLPWLLLGVLAYPVFVVAAWAYVRAAERAERDFADLVERR
ncbi:MAG TPA: hypothetical protein VFX33_09105 [Actinomycetales bacterium]|nr:hypothetical protein [Actinomycetales bacterium]